MRPLSDDAVLHAISNSPWDRLEAASRIHSVILAAVDEKRSEENLALLEAAETMLASVSDSQRPRAWHDAAKHAPPAEPQRRDSAIVQRPAASTTPSGRRVRVRRRSATLKTFGG